MKILPLVVFGAFMVLWGCAARPLPSMPSVETQQGRDCVRTCQREHRLCTSVCQGMLLEESKCLSQCNQKLEECYRLCVEEETDLN